MRNPFKFWVQTNSCRLALVGVLATGLMTSSCGDDDDFQLLDESGNESGNGNEDGNGNGGFTPIEVPATYTFSSRFITDGSSVFYTGQIKRHILIDTLKSFIGDLGNQTALNDKFADSDQAAIAESMTFFYDFAGDDTLAINIPTGEIEPLQATWADLSPAVNLKDKFAGVDPRAEFAEDVVGYPRGNLADDEVLSPTAVFLAMVDELSTLFVDRISGNRTIGPDGKDISNTFVSPEGIDYQQLIQKYLLGAIAFSQGADDYLDEGLDSSNDQSEDEAYSSLEHAWDEGFGYFGAARNYADYTDEEIAGGVTKDFNDDNNIDFYSEFNFGASTNAAKRDLGSSPEATTDYTKDAFDAFLGGRTLIVNANGDLSEDDMTKLLEFRDTAIGAWEKAIAATVVHYINDTLRDMNLFGVEEDLNDVAAPYYRFEDHAKHWSEMKGFALGLQFNVKHSPFSTDENTGKLAEILTQMGDAPVLPTATDEEIAAYKDALLSARQTLGEVYGFAAENLGDNDGLNGW
ncbi:MAG: DUF4856 domain-containing protein [Myxococcales bacterium]|nr:DUF4856 domain-containing protein [Myxococcales bacterium]